MTSREKELLEIIKNNPLISQNEIAEALGITRSSVAVHITNLQKKGYILGKGYIVQEDSYVCIIGGTNIDIQGFPKNPLILKDSNPGEVKLSLGGVGRNIGENLCKLDIETKLITVMGDDVYGNKIQEESRKIGLNLEHSLILKGQSTSTYLSILDHSGDMQLAISHMDIYENMTIDFIKSKSHVIQNAKLCILDTNVPKEVIEYIVTTHKNTDFFIDTVSTTKAQKILDLIGYFHTIKPNKYEAEILTGIKINSPEDLVKASNVLLEKGVKQVFITLGEEGLFYNNGTEQNIIKNPKITVVNATGAGDSFIAALAYGYYHHMPIDATARFAMTAAILALSHENTINPNLSVNTINNKMKELDLC